MTCIDTFEKVMEKVEELSAHNHDEMVAVRDMEFEALESMRISEEKVEVLPTAQRLLANRLKIPYSYLVRCPPDLQAENLNYWLSQEAKCRDNLFCRFKGDRLRAVFTDRYTAIDHTEIVSKMADCGFDPEREVHYLLDDGLLVLKVPDYRQRFDLKGNDIIPGISVANSEVGLLALSIEAYFYRLICSNGLISKTEISSRFKHVSRKALEKLPELLNEAVQESRNRQRQFQLSLESPVEDPPASIQLLGSQFKLTKNEIQMAQEAWKVERGYNLFYVMNAFTRGAQESSLSSEESYKLERVAGMVLDMDKKRSYAETM